MLGSMTTLWSVVNKSNRSPPRPCYRVRKAGEGCCRITGGAAHKARFRLSPRSLCVPALAGVFLPELPSKSCAGSALLGNRDHNGLRRSDGGMKKRGSWGNSGETGRHVVPLLSLRQAMIEARIPGRTAAGIESVLPWVWHKDSGCRRYSGCSRRSGFSRKKRGDVTTPSSTTSSRDAVPQVLRDEPHRVRIASDPTHT